MSRNAHPWAQEASSPWILIADFDRRFVLGMAAMDATHREFVDLVNRLATCDRESFVGSFPALV